MLFLGVLALGGCTTTSSEPWSPSGDADGGAGDDGDGRDAAPGAHDAATATDAAGTPPPAQDAGSPPGQDDGGPSDDGGASRDGEATPDATTPVGDASTQDDGSTADDAPTGAPGETGRLVGMTAAHNAVRAAVMTTPALPPLTWSTDVAAYAQAWATQLASNPTTCASPQHRSGAELHAMNYGENLAWYSARRSASSTAQEATDGWAAEKACWTYGTIEGTEQCDMTCATNLSSDGCGHYTQIVWRDSVLLGCGVATCQNGTSNVDIWICNYSPAGNIIGKSPY
jgi:hypothetical protein